MSISGKGLSKWRTERAPLPLLLTRVVLLQDSWPGVDQTGMRSTGAAQDGAQGAGKQTTISSAGQTASLPGSGVHKATDASRLVDAPPTFQDNTMVLPQLPEHHPAAVVPYLSTCPGDYAKCLSIDISALKNPFAALSTSMADYRPH